MHTYAFGLTLPSFVFHAATATFVLICGNVWVVLAQLTSTGTFHTALMGGTSLETKWNGHALYFSSQNVHLIAIFIVTELIVEAHPLYIY